MIDQLHPGNCVMVGPGGVLTDGACGATITNSALTTSGSVNPEAHHNVWTFATAHPYIFAILVFLILELLVVNAYRFAAGIWNDLRAERLKRQAPENDPVFTPRATQCKHANTHYEGSLGEFCSDCNRPVGSDGV